MENEIKTEQKESVKLIKNTKGYQWEIKLVHVSNIETQIERLENLNKEMKGRFEENGNKDGDN